MIAWANPATEPTPPTDNFTSVGAVGPTTTGGPGRKKVYDASLDSWAERSWPASPPPRSFSSEHTENGEQPFRGIALGVLLGAFLWALIGVTISWVW